MVDATLPRSEWEMLAAELALGVLDGPDRAQALRLTLSDPDFASEVAGWETRLGALIAEYRDIVPPAAMWAAIAARLPVPARRGVASISALRFWQGGTAVTGAIAASLALVLLTRTPEVPVTPVAPPPVTAPAPAIVASLTGEADGARFGARYDPDSATIKVRADAVPADAARVPELWVIPSDGVPRSLGLVAARGETKLTVATGLRALIADGATLAVTMEPADGAPHAAPSSTPIAAGKIAIL